MADIGGPLATRLEILDQRDVGRCAADIEGQDILQPRIFRHPQRAGDPACRAGHQDVDRMLLRLAGGHQSAVGAQQRQVTGEALVSQPLLQIGDIAADHRAHRGVGDGGQGALIFLHFRQNFMAQRHRNAGQYLCRQFADADFMRAIGIGVDQADGYRLDTLRLQGFQRGAGAGLVERAYFAARRIQPSLDRNRILQRGERLRLGPDDPCRQPAGDKAAGDLHDVAIALGRHQPDPRALALQHCIGGDCGAMQKRLDIAGGDTGLVADRLHAGEDALTAVMRGRWRLVPPEIPVAGVEQQQIGECPADIDTQTIGHAKLPYAATGKPPAWPTIPGIFLSMIVPSQRLASISASRSSPVAMPLRVSM